MYDPHKLDRQITTEIVLEILCDGGTELTMKRIGHKVWVETDEPETG